MIRRLVLSILLALGGVLPPAVLTTTERACAASQNHAAERIRFSVSDERSYCVTFSEQEITGIQALRLTGLPVVTKIYPPYGEFVCKIGEVGTDASDCPARDGSYWSYFYLDSTGVWYPWSVGASSAKVRCGAGEGWSWFPRGVGAPPSAPTSFASMCPGRSCEAQASPAPTGGAAPPQQGALEPGGSPPSRTRTGKVPSATATAGSPSPSETPGETRSPFSTLGEPRATPEKRGRPAEGALVAIAAVLISLSSLGLYLRHRMKGS